MTEPTFHADDAVRVQCELRRRLGLNEEEFSLPSFVGMISDEIEQMRAAGHTDADIAKIVREVTGKVIDPADIGRHYASSEARHPGRD